MGLPRPRVARGDPARLTSRCVPDPLGRGGPTARAVAGHLMELARGDHAGDPLGVVHERAQPLGARHRVGRPAGHQPVGQQPVAALGEHALGVELHALQRQRRGAARP